jgi:hypothetical protein
VIPAVNYVWAYDFVFDTCADGRILKCLTVIDEVTAIDVASGMPTVPKSARRRSRLALT